MWMEVLQVLRGMGRVGTAFISIQGEQLRLMACNSTVGAGVKAAEDLVESIFGAAVRSSTVGTACSTVTVSDGCPH